MRGSRLGFHAVSYRQTASVCTPSCPSAAYRNGAYTAFASKTSQACLLFEIGLPFSVLDTTTSRLTLASIFHVVPARDKNECNVARPKPFVADQHAFPVLPCFLCQSYEAGNQPLVAFVAVNRKKKMHLRHDLLWYGSQKKTGKKEYVVLAPETLI